MRPLGGEKQPCFGIQNIQLPVYCAFIYFWMNISLLCAAECISLCRQRGEEYRYQVRTITYLQVKIYSKEDESIFSPEARLFCESCVASPRVVSMLCICVCVCGVLCVVCGRWGRYFGILTLESENNLLDKETQELA